MIAPDMEVAFARLKDDRAGILTGICIAIDKDTKTAWVTTDSKHFFVHINDVVSLDDEEAYAEFSQRLDAMYPTVDSEEDHWKDGGDLADAVQEILARPPVPLPQGIFHPPASVFGRHRG